MKNVKLKVDNSNVMSSIERASINVTSPTGKTLYLYKHKLSKASKELQDVFWKFCKDPMVRFRGEMDATEAEMKLLLEFSKL